MKKEYCSSPRLLMTAALMTTGAISPAAAQTQHSAGTEKPNVLFLFVDDMTFDGVAELGNAELKTPNLDRLVAGGTAFVNTYNMGGWHGAVSVASRSMLMTGCYLWKARDCEREKYLPSIENREMWVQVMKDAGYETYMTGKWHIKDTTPEQFFDETEDVRPGGCPGLAEVEYDRPKSPEDNAWIPWDKKWGGYWEGGRHWTEVQADDAVRYLDRYGKSDKPFFMYVAFNAPHDPRQAPKEFYDMYPVDEVSVPENFQPEHPLKELMGCPETMRDERLAPFPRTEYAVRKHRQEYYAIITHLDREIGRILDQLKKSGLEEKTLVIFAADNGLSCGHHGLMGKQNVYEHSMRVPLVFSGYGIPKNEKRDCLNYMQDLVPTVYDIAGIRIPEHVDFRSLVPALEDAHAVHYPAVYGAYRNHQRMVRNDRYKLVFIPEARTAYLFDLIDDPQEMRNLYGDPAFDEVVAGLVEVYKKLAAEAGDTQLKRMAEFYPELFS